MKKSHVILLIAAVIILLKPFSWCNNHSEDDKSDKSAKGNEEQIFERDTYLVDECTVIDSDNCTIYRATGRYSEKIPMAGDEYGIGGF
ncbi:MAG: hypothetical protein E7117_02995 [Bacteroidales bacterium]|nr:hypothetical protein [Bacteroidales bacterium]